MEHIRYLVTKFLAMFEEDVFHEVIGLDEYFGPPSEGEGPHVDPRNWDLYWVTHPNGPLEGEPRDKSFQGHIPELEFPREDVPQGLIDCLVQKVTPKEEAHRTKSITQDEEVDEVDTPEVDAPEIRASQSDGEEATELSSTIAKLSSILETKAFASESQPRDTDVATEITLESGAKFAAHTSSLTSNFQTFLSDRPKFLEQAKGKLVDIKGLMTAMKMPTIKLPTMQMPTLKLPVLVIPNIGISSQPAKKTMPTTHVKKEPKRIHYERTPLATYSRVKSRLQDRPPLVVAFADQVSVLSPSTLVPKQNFVEEVPKGDPSSAKEVLLKNLRDLLPTPLAALVGATSPRKRSLISILGSRAAKKVVAEVEHDPLDDSMIPQYQKWKKIKNKKLHNAQWSCLIIACILLICAVQIRKLREIKWLEFEFWQWLALGFVALAGRLVSGWGVKLIVILIEYNFLLKKRILYFIFGLRRPVKNNLWLGLILLTWTIVIQHTEDKSNTIPAITKLLVCAFTASTLWVAKVLLVKILANTFHRTAYFDRIQDSLFHEYVLETLSEPRSHRLTMTSRKGREDGTDGTRRKLGPVFKLRVAPSQKKLTGRDAKKQGRIERQYSPTPIKSWQRKKPAQPRQPAWQRYHDTKRTFTSLGDSLAMKVPVIFPFANLFPPSFQTISSAPFFKSPKSLNTQSSCPKTLANTSARFNASVAHTKSMPSSLKGGAELPPTLVRSILKAKNGGSHVDRTSRSKVGFQEVVEVVEHPSLEYAPVEYSMEYSYEVVQYPPAMVVESSPQLAALIEDEVIQGVSKQEVSPPELFFQEQEVIQPEVVLEEQEDSQPELFFQEQEDFQVEAVLEEQKDSQPELFQEQVIQPQVILQVKEDIQPEVGLQVEQAPPVESPPISSPEVGEPPVVTPVPIPIRALILEAKKSPAFVEPDIEMEEGELEDDTGHEQQTSLAQDKIQVLTKDSVSAWTLMRLMKVVRTRNLHMYSKSSFLEPDWEIDSIPMATAAAKHIFKNVAEPGQQQLLLKNFMKFFPPDKATQAFSTFEVTVDGTITQQGLLKWVLDVYKERKSLSLTLNDNRSVIYQVNLLLDGVLISVILAISFLIMGFNNQTLLACTSTLLVPAVSIFGNLFRNTFESLLFLFIMHPFDVGDRVFIEGVPLMVEEMRIMSTLFLNNSSEHITYPNFILINKPIANIHRSPDQWDSIEFQILANTSLEKLSILKNRIDKYVLFLPQIWYPRWRLVVRDIENTNKLRLLMTIQHHINFQDAGERTQRRSDMLLHIQGLMLELEIDYKLPPSEALVNLPLGNPSLSVEYSFV